MLVINIEDVAKQSRNCGKKNHISAKSGMSQPASFELVMKTKPVKN